MPRYPRGRWTLPETRLATSELQLGASANSPNSASSALATDSAERSPFLTTMDSPIPDAA